MNTALARRENLLPDTGTWKTMLEMAGELVASGLLPKGIDKPAAALAIIQKGLELQSPPMYALSNIGIINGKPVVGAEVLLAMVYRDHGDQAIQFEDTSAERCSVIYKRRSWPQARRFEWTIEDAKKAGLLGKGGPWNQYPAAMLRARCVSAVARLAFPDSIGGMYTPEELGAEVTVTDDGEIEVIQPPAPVVSFVPKAEDIETSGDAVSPERVKLEREYGRLADLAVERGHKHGQKIKDTVLADKTDEELHLAIGKLQTWEASLPPVDDSEAF